jgi:DNA-binding CsgD family transcriptional regulator
MWRLSIQHSVEHGPFAGDDLKWVADLSTSLSAAATDTPAIRFARAEGALSAFDACNLPAVLLNDAGAIRLSNKTAERLFESELKIRGVRIAAVDPKTNRALQDSLNEAKSLAASSVLMPPIVFPQRGEKRALLGCVVRFAEASVGDGLLFLVFIDLDAELKPPDRVLQECLGLSYAEARLAQGIAAGKTIDALAADLAITRNTVRQRLKAVFAKLDVHRQSELVAMLARLLRNHIAHLYLLVAFGC